MIRPISPADVPALTSLFESLGLFGPEEVAELQAMLDRHGAGTLGKDHHWLADDDNGLAAIAYFAPERMTNGTWNLYLIGVHPDRRRQGRAAALLAHVEDFLRGRGERLLLIETSGDPALEPAWALYGKSGYEQEARIRDFYDAGADKIVYRKAL